MNPQPLARSNDLTVPSILIPPITNLVAYQWLLNIFRKYKKAEVNYSAFSFYNIYLVFACEINLPNQFQPFLGS